MAKGIAAAVSIFALSLSAWAAKKPVTIDDVLHERGQTTEVNPVWAPNGTEFLVTEHGALSVYDVRSGKSRDIVALDKLRDAAVKPPPSTEYSWTNRRVEEEDQQWFSDNRRVLVSEGGDLFIIDSSNGAFDQLTKTPEVEHDPKLSPDNNYVSFRRGSDLYTLEIASRKVVRLTTSGTETLLNGELDWVYPEELYLSTAHWWSPDSRHIAYLQFDISREPVFPQVSLLGVHATLEPERFPQPGDPNAEVRLGVVPATGGETRWMALGDPRDHLLARVVWLPSSAEVAAERLNRVQNKLDLLIANIETGASRAAIHEEDPTWINVKDEPIFLNNGKFIWTSERDGGFRHMYVYGNDGTLQNRIDSGDWEVTDISGVDESHNRVFYVSTEASPLQRQLYVISLDGTGKRQVSSGAGTHSISLSPAAEYYLDTYSSLTAPPRSTLYTSDGAQVRVYREPDLKQPNEYNLLPTELVTVTAVDGTPLFAHLIKPANFDSSKKYPAVVVVYGGPGVQTVTDEWSGLSWDQVLANEGFVIWQLDNRGSSGRGHKFESVIYHDLGAHELEDQKTGIQHLISMGFVDPARIGLFGWSYGGYMTLYTVTNAPGLIKAAISGAPVTNWRLYDSIYTERYMGLPENDEHAYQVSSPITSAANLQSRLLILHNMEDDNVHFQNSVQMANALEAAGKLFTMVVYAQRSHGVGGADARQLLEEMTRFFEQNLK